MAGTPALARGLHDATFALRDSYGRGTADVYRQDFPTSDHARDRRAATLQRRETIKPAVPSWGWVGLYVVAGLAAGFAGGTGVLEGGAGWLIALLLGGLLGALLEWLLMRPERKVMLLRGPPGARQFTTYWPTKETAR
jgi:hypothetical protein